MTQFNRKYPTKEEAVAARAEKKAAIAAKRAEAPLKKSIRKAAHEQIKQRKLILDPTQFNTRNVEQVVLEAALAEHNFDVILTTARDLATGSLLAHQSTRFNIKPLEVLIKDLKSSLALTRRAIRDEHPNVDIGNGRVAETLEAPFDPHRTTYKCLCPLTTLLQIIATSLSEMRVKVGPNLWGTIKPLQKKLESLQLRLKGFLETRQEATGLAKCIMFHEEHGIFTVVGTTPAYKFLSGLDRVAIWIRNRHLAALTSNEGLSTETRELIDRKTKQSQKIVDALKNAGDNDQIWESTLEQHKDTVSIAGAGATFHARGDYRLACIVDFCRFSMARYDPGEVESLSTAAERKVYGVNSCAEWELWLVKLVSGPVKPPPALVYKPKMSGISHSNTFPEQPRRQTPPAAYRYAARMTNVPAPTSFNLAPPLQRKAYKSGKVNTWEHTADPPSSQKPEKKPTKQPKSRGTSWWC